MDTLVRVRWFISNDEHASRMLYYYCDRQRAAWSSLFREGSPPARKIKRRGEPDARTKPSRIDRVNAQVANNHAKKRRTSIFRWLDFRQRRPIVSGTRLPFAKQRSPPSFRPQKQYPIRSRSRRSSVVDRIEHMMQQAITDEGKVKYI